MATANDIQIHFVSPLAEEQQEIIKHHLAIELNKAIARLQDCVD